MASRSSTWLGQTVSTGQNSANAFGRGEPPRIRSGLSPSVSGQHGGGWSINGGLAGSASLVGGCRPTVAGRCWWTEPGRYVRGWVCPATSKAAAKVSEWWTWRTRAKEQTRHYSVLRRAYSGCGILSSPIWLYSNVRQDVTMATMLDYRNIMRLHWTTFNVVETLVGPKLISNSKLIIDFLNLESYFE